MNKIIPPQQLEEFSILLERVERFYAGSYDEISPNEALQLGKDLGTLSDKIYKESGVTLTELIRIIKNAKLEKETKALQKENKDFLDTMRNHDRLLEL